MALEIQAPVRQWVLSVPKRLRYLLQADPAVQNLALHIFLSAVEHGLRAACPAAQDSPIPTARIGAVAFIHRFGALLNPHVHFHCVVVDGVFEAGTEADETVRFHETPALSSEQLADAPLRAAVTALAGAKDEVPATVAIVEGNQPAVDPEPVSPNAAPEVIAEPAHRKAARYVWALLLARIYEVLPLV